MTASYKNNNEVKAGPNTGEVFVQPEGEPLQYHFHSKENGKNQVDDF